MSSISFNRRAFIRTSSLASGGLLVGFNFFTACKDSVKPPIDISKLNFNDFNAFIKIADNGMVTIFSPNPEIGQGVKTSMPMLIAEELDVAWENVYVQQGLLDTDNYKNQYAGGSNSIRLAWEPLRQTGATTRQMLINAAAARWGVDAKECTTSEGVITNAKGETLGYGDVVKEAAQLEVPEEFILKKPKDFKIIGTDAQNVDIDKIITGKPLFGLDYKAEGMVYASVLRAPAFGQKLQSFNDSETKTIEGVIAVHQFGDKVAVLASNTWSAMKGKKALRAEWVTDTKLESSADHDQILIDLLDGSNFETLRKDGDVEKAFAEADTVLERTYEAPFLPHNCMEPMNFYANVTDKKIHLVGPIQTPEGTAKGIAAKLERPFEDVHLEMTRMGGGFGRRLYGDFAIEAAEISNISRKPIKVIFSREDDMTDGIYRPATKYRIKASIKGGEITGYQLKEAAIDSNMYGLIPNFFPAGAIENYQVDVAKYESNITTGAWRAPYTNFLAFAEQSFFDELAEVMNVDKIQMRLDLLDKVKGTTDSRIQYSPERMQAVIKKAVDKSGWGKEKEGTYQGFAAYYCHNTHVAEVADVVIEKGMPVVKKVTCVIDCGIVVNPLGAMNQVEGGVIDGIGHAMYGDFSFSEGKPSAQNFDQYRLIRMNEIPKIDAYFIESDLAPTGLGEPTLPPAGAALANAIKAATGNRLLKQPFSKYPELLKIPQKVIVG
ncbi:xanthine dehydrogenase family protein molybdopterin-binding subunit [Cellulophaga sp. HaHaR_3_176]|uniref:xanthine dehydrogenase family protein molybdopterin-binding subunit n=1 Tax=Cellulophaga sp. HaHaR_3_176 TaxID=1942464 RepID=UPI001C1F4B67|nr:molybdopterin cofactor-binding domain-containing protein [Cellulophaga sp. HaHaR_3_176]QWX85294.1 xanthine dehydrogenase family protein molybdopterin-binding subunit [Cellulophaga sp. HaHaR_3_176]